MAEPLAYFISWRTYGTWLPGDARGWVDDAETGIQEGDANRWLAAREQMKGEPVVLTISQRDVVEATIRKHCTIRGWELHAVNARTNHIHVVMTANLDDPNMVRDQFKAWCTRNLNEQFGRRIWWAGKGSCRWINDQEHLRNAIRYVLEGQ